MQILQLGFCDYPPSKLLCNDAMFMILGVNSTQLNITRIPVYSKHTLAGTSTRTLLHMGQLIDHEKFQMYDYMSESSNQEHYGQPTPPQYDVTHMETPVVLYSSDDHDYLAHPEDVKTLKEQLKKVLDVKASKHLSDFFNLDFIYGMRATNEIYKPMIEDIGEDFTKDQ